VQALEAQRALQESSRAITNRNREWCNQEEALREEIQERNYQPRVQRQVPQAPTQACQAPPQPRDQQEQVDHGLPPRQDQHEDDYPPCQGCHHHHRQQHNEEQCYDKLKFTMPKFNGSNHPEEYLSWALKVDKIFRLHNYEEEKKIAMASLEFLDYVLIWWEQVLER